MVEIDREKLTTSANSLVLAATCTANAIYAVLTYTRGIEGAASIFLIAVYALGLAVQLGVNHFHVLVKGGKKYLLYELFLFAAYGLTVLFAEKETTMTLWNFIFYCFLPPLFLLFKYDTEKVLRYGMYLSLISCLEINTLLVDQAISWRFSQTNLGTIYDLLPCVVFAIFHFAYYRKQSGWFTKLCYLYYLYFLVRMLLVIVRGALLTLLVGVVLIYLNNPRSDRNEIRKWTLKKKCLVGLGALIGVLGILNYESVIIWLYEFLQARNINFGVITKFYFYMSTGNITDNREPYYALVREMFRKSPLWGTGVLTFYAYSPDGAAYPHNYILQFLFEGGLLLMLPLAFLSLRELYRVITSKYVGINKTVLVSCLLLLSVVPGMFSMNIWYCRTFWLVPLLGLTTAKNELRS